MLDIVQTFDVQVFDDRPSGPAAGTDGKRTDRRHTMSRPSTMTTTTTSTDPRTGEPARRPSRHLALVPTDPPPSAVAPAPGLRLTARGRAVVVVLAAGLALGGVLSAQSAAAGGPHGAVPVSAHVVRSGETVWEIAAAVAAPGQDVRDVVAEIQELNGLRGAEIRAGQRLVVPAG